MVHLNHQALITHRASCWTDVLSVIDVYGTDKNACPAYAVNDVPQPQLPVALGLVNVNPEPMTPVT